MAKILSKCPICGGRLEYSLLMQLRAISAGLDSNSIDCTYHVEEEREDDCL